MSSLNSQELVRLYQEGQEEAATALYDKYARRLLALARTRIGPRLKRRLDAEDVIQSAYRSFFVHAKNAEYQVKKAGDLWRLLASITLHKLYGQIEKHTAAKRSVNHEEDDLATVTATIPEPSPAEVVALAEQWQLVVQDLSSAERRVLSAKLQGQTVTQIATAVTKSERTVRRLLASARQKIEHRLLSKDDADVRPALPIDERVTELQHSAYVLEKLLGSGAMGKVFRARLKNSGKVVAVKALHKARQSDDRVVAQFVQEAQVLARLRHPNIVRVEGLGRFPGGGFFMAMEFVDGVDLQTRLHTEVLPVLEALTIVSSVAGAIGHAHDNGIVHCDLKPGNILQKSNGTIAVTDFGFAYLLTERASTTNSSIGGTAGFIAPEVLRGSRHPTPASDIYSLGALLWALVTGHPPAQPIHLRASNETLAPIARITNRCLSTDPMKRFQTTAELQREILAYLQQLRKV